MYIIILNIIKLLIQLLFITDEVRSTSLTVKDEVHNGLYFLTGTVWDTIPRIYKDIDLAARQAFKEPIEIPGFLKYRSWIGGDRDGNPFVTSDITDFAILENRNALFELYEKELTERRKDFKPLTHKFTRGVLGKFSKLVGSASKGAVCE